LLIQKLREEAGFTTYRHILLLAAGVGVAKGRRRSLVDSGEKIRYETVTEPLHSSTLIAMIAATQHPDDAEILDEARLAERIADFEAYVTGGLDVIQEELNTRQATPEQIIADLVHSALVGEMEAETASVDDLIRALD
jgi:dnd system-associated protein 4